MKGFDSSWLQQYENRARRSSQGSLAESPVRPEPVAKKKREAGHPTRLRVGVRSFRRRLCDPDNLCPKYFIDCLRYAGFIPDDSPDHITLEVSQERVESVDEERTVITIES